MPVPKVTSSALAPAIGDPTNPFEAAAPAPLPILPSKTLEGLAQLASAETPTPAFEEMAVPAPPSRGPMPLTPRNLDPGPAPDVLRVRPSSAQRAMPAPSPPRPALAQPSVRANPPPTPVVARPGPEPAASLPVNGKVVQLGAFRDRDVAEKALAAWRGTVPAVFQSAAAPIIVAAELGAKGTYYRIRIAGFADSRKAGDFCAAFRGGGRDCFVVQEP